MKKLAFLALLLLGTMAASAQKADTARMVVNRYLSLMNLDAALRSDSVLFVETAIVQRDNPKDTVWMRRWYVKPNLARVELWRKGKLSFGIYGNGKGKYRHYEAQKKVWLDAQEDSYLDVASAYDFRTPLYFSRTNGMEMEYKGEWNYNSNEVQRILVSDPVRYDRYYLFEKKSGLLFLIQELDSHSEDMATGDAHKVDWRAYHEYVPFGTFSLLPSVESYQADGIVTFQHHTYRYLPLDLNLFNNDRP